MKIIRAIAAVAFFAAISAVSVVAQPKPTTTAAPATTGSATGNVPDTKLALVDTDQFLDEKAGIVRLVTAAKKVENEFLPRRTELQGIQASIDKRTPRKQKATPPHEPTRCAQKQYTTEQKQREPTSRTKRAQTTAKRQ